MIYATCIKKYRNNKNIITGYRLMYTNHEVVDVTPEQLKTALAECQIEIDNLQLTSDNRLIPKQLKNNANVTIACIKPEDIYDMPESRLNLNLKFKTNTDISSFETKAQLVDTGAKIIKAIPDIHILRIKDNLIVLTEAKHIIAKSCNKLFASTKFASVDMKNIDTAMVNDTSKMFYHAQINSIDLSTINTINVKNMSQMFFGFTADYLNLSNLNTSNVKYMFSMFKQCKINSINLSSFNTSNVEDMSHMFDGCEIDNLDLTNFDTSNVRDIRHMFRECKINNLNISSFDYSKINSLDFMFYYCSIGTLNIGNFNIKDKISAGYFIYYSNIEKIITSRKNQSNIKISARCNSIGNLDELRNVFCIR